MNRLSIFCSVLLIIATGCKRREETRETSVHKITIAQWGQERYLIYLPVYLAQSQHFFEKHKITTNLLFSGNDDQVFATVVRGDAQFGVGDPIFTAISAQRGLPGVMAASIVGRVALWGVAKKGAKPIRKPEDLAGLRIGTFPRPSTTYTLLADTLNQSHVKATLIEVQIGSELSLLESGAVDLVFLLEPAASIAESKGYSIVVSLPKLWGDFAFTGLNTTRAYANANPVITANVRAAVDDALRFAHDNSSATIETAQQLFPNVDPKVIERAVDRMISERTIPTSADPSRTGWIHAVQVRQQIGDLKPGSDFLQCLWKPN